MKYMVCCGECGSTNLTIGKEILGANTIGEREEVVFKCTQCDEVMSTDEIYFEEWD